MSTLPKVVLVYPLTDPAGERMLEEKTRIVRPKGDDQASLREALADADAICLRGPARLTAELIEQAPRLKVIGAQGSGTDNIDVAAATRRGIPVIHGAGAAPRAVAEYTLAAMVAAHRGFLASHRRITSGPVDWIKRQEEQGGTELTGTTLGIIGFGYIGKLVAKVARAAFDLQVLAYDPFIPRDSGGQLARLVDNLDEMLEASLTVTVHASLNPTSRGLVRRTQLRRIGPNGALVHVARGGIVDEADLVAALKAGELKAAVVDVYENEPPTREQVARLAEAPNIFLTPHNAGWTDQSKVQLSQNVAQGVLDVLAGRPPRKVANPEVLKR